MLTPWNKAVKIPLLNCIPLHLSFKYIPNVAPSNIHLLNNIFDEIILLFDTTVIA